MFYKVFSLTTNPLFHFKTFCHNSPLTISNLIIISANATNNILFKILLTQGPPTITGTPLACWLLLPPGCSIKLRLIMPRWQRRQMRIINESLFVQLARIYKPPTHNPLPLPPLSLSLFPSLCQLKLKAAQKTQKS